MTTQKRAKKSIAKSSSPVKHKAVRRKVKKHKTAPVRKKAAVKSSSIKKPLSADVLANLMPKNSTKIKSEIYAVLDKVENNNVVKKLEKLLEKLEAVLAKEGTKVIKKGKAAVKKVTKKVKKGKAAVKKVTKKVTKKVKKGKTAVKKVAKKVKGKKSAKK